MVFSSLVFLYVFLPLCLLGCALCKTLRGKNICLLLFSLFFYAWGEPKYVLLLMFMSLCDWFAALMIDSSRSPGTRKLWLGFACVLNIGLIALFKYSNMLWSVFAEPPEFIKNIALPIGISFYTFQLLTYVIDIYRKEAPAQRSYLNILLYASLFHQCIAGPIVRYKTVAQELFVQRSAWPDMTKGVRRFAKGLAKKVILANACGYLADTLLLAADALGDPAQFSANMEALSSLSVLGSWIGVAAYALQIYFDFSAYSDMAIGMGQMAGLHYLENFDHPYIARSVSEFWNRWHISLGTFFKDYVYIPLGGNRKGAGRTIFNLFVVWALTGLWHGASWNFVLWGLYFFVFIAAEKLFLGNKLKKHSILSHIYLLLVVLFGWLIFRFNDVRFGFTVFKGMFGLNGNSFTDFATSTLFKNNVYILIFCVIVCMPVGETFKNIIGNLKKRSRGFRSFCDAVSVIALPVTLLLPAVLLFLSTAGLVGASYNPFIYFQF